MSTEEERAAHWEAVKARIRAKVATSRQPSASPPLPRQLTTAALAAGRAIAAVATGQPVKVPSEEFNRRKAICVVCPEYDAPVDRCKKCACYLAVKPWLKAESCPLKKW